MIPIDELNKYLDVPFEKWPIKLSAVSANANGIVQSGILSTGQYFTRKDFNNTVPTSKFVWGHQFFNK